MMLCRSIPNVAVCVAVGIVALRAPAQHEIAPTRIDPPALAGAMAPKLHSLDGKTALLTWLEPAPVQPAVPQESSTPLSTEQGATPPKRILQLRFARFDGTQWSEPRTIVQRDDFFANWADVPSITQAKNGSLIAHWLQKSGPGTYSYDIMLARSTDGGETWKTLGKLHDDHTLTEHGFVSMVAEGEGIHAFWLDGRNMKPQDEGDEGHGDGHEHAGGDMTLRTALITGETIGPSHLLDVRICECCNTSAAVTANGPLIVYRDRSEQDTRDISIVRQVEKKWTDPKAVHDDGWQISACPVNGPAIAARGSHVAVAWFTGAQFKPRVMLAMSTDGGATFSPPMTIDDAEPFGRVALALHAVQPGSGTGNGNGGAAATICWLATDDDPRSALIKLERVQPGRPSEEPIIVSKTTSARGGGFPTIACLGERTIVVWTEGARPTHLRAMLVTH